MRTTPFLAGLGGAALLASAMVTIPGHAAPVAAVKAFVRVDQVGYLRHEAKHAFLMTSAPVRGERFTVVDAGGHAVLHGAVSRANRGRWSSAFPAVYDIAFTSLTRAGRYTIKVHGSARATSWSFRVMTVEAMYRKVLTDGVAFDQVQRDGADIVKGRLDRKAAHLNDRSARVYKWPHFEPGSDVITDAGLTRLAGPVNVAGGWADAGDYLKFVHSTAYNDVVLLATERNLAGKAPK
jgi:endoglucanase